MIYTEISKLDRFKGMNKNLDTFIDYVQSHKLTELLKGRNEVDGDKVYINRFDYTTIEEKDAFYEAHIEYADIHMIVSGEEQIKIADIHTLQEFERDEATDYVGYRGECQSICNMNTEKILIVFPEDAHMVKLQYNQPCFVEKAVGKVKVK